MNTDVVVYKTLGKFRINTLQDWNMWIETYKVPATVRDSARERVISDLCYRAIFGDNTNAAQGVLQEIWEGVDYGHKF